MASEVSDDLSEVGAENEGVPVSSSSSVSNDLISELPSFMSETEDSNSYLELSSSETDSYLGYKHKDDASSKSSSSDLTQMSSSKDAEDNGSGSGSKVKFPVRPGIIWRKGERVEAEDYQKHWYSSKIMNINEETKSVLIHFEGWNQRYDEWVDMNSERLRPLTRHSERREKRRRGKTVYRVGDQVLAKWTDCKMYLAKVDEVMNDGSYMVLFYDGFRRNIQPINLRPVPMEQKQQKFQIKPPVLSPKDLKNIKTKPVDFRGKQVAISNASGTGVITCQTGERLAKPLSHASGGQKKPKLIISGSLFSKKGKVLPKSRPKGVLHNKLKNVAKVNEKREIKIKKEQAVFSEEAAEVSSQTRTASIGPKNPVCQKRPRSGSFPEEKNKRMKVIGQLKTSDDPGMIKKAKSVDIDKTVESPVSLLPPILPLPTAPPKAFFVEEDHNLFKCDTCCKGFRKNQLLQDHIKHYHKTEILQLTSTVTKKRTKTLSTCSTDSDISASSKSNSAKRRRNISEMSVGSPEVALKMSFEEESPSAIVMASSEINVMEASVAEIEEDTSDEVVNCICGCREETGTMIQCDCCQCWQHTSCFGFTDQDLTSDTFLNTYVCFVCKQPRGLRENARYLYDMDWFRRGRLPIFSFVKAEGIENSEIPILGTHALISELLVVQKVMHGLREEIALTGERDHQELQLWQPQPTKDLHSISIGVTADKQEDNLQSANLSALVNNDFLTTKTEPGTVNILESTVCAGNSISSETEREARTFGNTKTLSLKRPKTKYTECISKAQTCSFSLASSKVVESGFKSFKEKSKEIKDISKSAEDVHFMDSYMKNCKNGDKTHDTEECSNKTNGRFSTGHFGISEEQKCEKAKSTTHCDPFAACKLSMLNCIQSVHEDLSHQLDNLELQILALEHQEYGADGGSCYSTIPPLKNSLHRLDYFMPEVDKSLCCGRPHNQLNITTIRPWTYICSKHFVDGKPTEENPDPVQADETIIKKRKLPFKWEHIENVQPSCQKRKKLENISSTMNTQDYHAEENEQDFPNCSAGSAVMETCKPAIQNNASATNQYCNSSGGDNFMETQHIECHKCGEKICLSPSKVESLVRLAFAQKIFASDVSCFKYTGIPTVKMLQFIFQWVNKATKNIKFWNNMHKYVPGRIQNRGRKMYKVSNLVCFILTLVRIRKGFDMDHLSFLFKISQSHVSRIFTSWVNILNQCFKQLLKWPRKDISRTNLPETFQMFPRTRCIIDCTEFQVQKPFRPVAQKMTWSNYKHNNTAKLLVGIMPAGTIIFISKLYVGSVSDKEIVKKSGFLNMIEEGDDIMADRGFNIRHLLLSKKATLNIPCFSRGSRLTEKAVKHSRAIASVRIHVERAIGRMKTFKLLCGIIPLKVRFLMNQVFPLNHYCDSLSPYWQVDGHENIAASREIILGETKAYIFFNKNYGDLHSYVRLKKRLNEDESRRLFCQIVMAICHCHNNGVILRDLKLRKFVFEDNERTKLQLEGLEDAVVLSQEDHDVLKDKHGCPAYVSPEILSATETGYSGKSADVWSLGVMLYTMLVGRYPFHDSQPLALFGKIRRGYFHIPDSLSPKARCLIRCLLRHEPAQRLSADEILSHPWFQSIPSLRRPANHQHSKLQIVPEVMMPTLGPYH